MPTMAAWSIRRKLDDRVACIVYGELGDGKPFGGKVGCVDFIAHLPTVADTHYRHAHVAATTDGEVLREHTVGNQ